MWCMRSVDEATYGNCSVPAGAAADDDNGAQSAFPHVGKDGVRYVQHAKDVGLKLLHGGQRSVQAKCGLSATAARADIDRCVPALLQNRLHAETCVVYDDVNAAPY